ncbi:MAG: hypothetical protein H0U84_10140 [Thermoleophilaceae bacterium]|nr:hypothetical protein [Thermoleophilaceae bacterium]
MTEHLPGSSPSASPEELDAAPEGSGPEVADEDSIRALVIRLARPHSSGGDVIERAAVLAEGADYAAVMAWIRAHGGVPETVPAAPSGGLHGARVNRSGQSASSPPRRFVLPAGTLH